LKKKLEADVTEIKNNLEKYLSKSVKYIKKDEKIDKGIKILEKEKEINIYKYFNYISKINKINTKMIDFLNTNMSSLKLSLNDENNFYEDYYFNGIPIPKDIQYKEQNRFLDISWKIDNYTNIDNNLILYKIEAKKENEQFIEVNKGKNNFCQLQNLEYGINYELRICSIYNDLMAFSKDILKIKMNYPNYDLFGSNFNHRIKNNPFSKNTKFI
jgi:hypothetical protein